MRRSKSPNISVAKVIATSGSEEKCRRLRQLGADVTIDVSQTDFLPEVLRVTNNRGVDVVLEMIGGEVYQKSLQALAPGGRLFLHRRRLRRDSRLAAGAYRRA